MKKINKYLMVTSFSTFENGFVIMLNRNEIFKFSNYFTLDFYALLNENYQEVNVKYNYIWVNSNFGKNNFFIENDSITFLDKHIKLLSSKGIHFILGRESGKQNHQNIDIWNRATAPN